MKTDGPVAGVANGKRRCPVPNWMWRRCRPRHGPISILTAACFGCWRPALTGPAGPCASRVALSSRCRWTSVRSWLEAGAFHCVSWNSNCWPLSPQRCSIWRDKPHAALPHGRNSVASLSEVMRWRRTRSTCRCARSRLAQCQNAFPGGRAVRIARDVLSVHRQSQYPAQLR